MEKAKEVLNKTTNHELLTLSPEDFTLAIKKDFGLDISNVEQIEQGYSSQVYKVLIDGKTAFIKTIDKPDIYPVEVLGYGILSDLKIPAPTVIAYQDHPQTIGHPTIILSGAEGTQLSKTELTPNEEDTVYEEMGNILKKIHQVKLEGFGRLKAEDGKLRGRFESWNQFWESLDRRYQDDITALREQGLLNEEELRMLDEARSEIGSVDIEQGTLIHRDMHRGHVFVTEDKITGIIDLGALEAGDPRYDIAMSMVFQDPKQQQAFKKGYGELADDPFVNKYLLCIAARKIMFRAEKGKKHGIEEAIKAFRCATISP